MQNNSRQQQQQTAPFTFLPTILPWLFAKREGVTEGIVRENASLKGDRIGMGKRRKKPANHCPKVVLNDQEKEKEKQ
jgi:hypothetical protein